jgi:hypothetical protein
VIYDQLQVEEPVEQQPTQTMTVQARTGAPYMYLAATPRGLVLSTNRAGTLSLHRLNGSRVASMNVKAGSALIQNADLASQLILYRWESGKAALSGRVPTPR